MSTPNHSLSTATPERTSGTQLPLLLFGLCVTIAAATVVGGVSSLLSLLKTRRKNPLCVIVASMSVDDLLSVVPLCLFLLLQLESSSSGSLCTLSGLLYVFQGLSSNMKACLIAAYTFYVTKRFGLGFGSTLRCRGSVLWAVAAVWAVSLCVSVLPLCGWGSFTHASLGCFPESSSLYILLLFSLYSVCLCGLLIFFLPLTYQLLCSTEPHTALLYRRSVEVSGTAPLCRLQAFSEDSLDKSFYRRLSPSLCRTVKSGEPGAAAAEDAADGDTPVLFAQRRFSMILAVLRVVLWMPMMTLVLLRHALDAHSSSLETLSFFLTLLAPAVTPLFMLSERWIHLPCGCFINCNPVKKRFEFSLSVQHGCGVYKLSHASTSPSCPALDRPNYHSLYNCHFSNPRLDALEGSGLQALEQGFDFSTTSHVDSSSHAELLLDAVTVEDTEATTNSPPLPHQSHGDGDGICCVQHELNLNDTASVFEGSERRLSHEECQKMELTDWEWCRSKSERTSRQRSSGGLSVPLCAFQGTVSLEAPTGKTFSLSTYEVSSDGLRISPNTAKKVEVFRSKSVGHEPTVVGDTNVKIHLEVLEICDNEEAMDSVSIVSNISQSSAHTRSPSLRYSRRENRFVSCDLGETASYSLLIPSGGNPERENINISIPDTVEAHRQNSRRQMQDSTGYHEEIQMLNEAYRKSSADREE
uniref:G protein-coupled receptor 149 n=1 Tax=Cynoglossus semilaevis TaxID=244447 RepID=A0A3P8W3B6_CYNSE